MSRASVSLPAAASSRSSSSAALATSSDATAKATGDGGDSGAGGAAAAAAAATTPAAASRVQQQIADMKANRMSTVADLSNLKKAAALGTKAIMCERCKVNDAVGVSRFTVGDSTSSRGGVCAE